MTAFNANIDTLDYFNEELALNSSTKMIDERFDIASQYHQVRTTEYQGTNRLDELQDHQNQLDRHITVIQLSYHI